MVQANMTNMQQSPKLHVLFYEYIMYARWKAKAVFLYLFYFTFAQLLQRPPVRAVH